MLLVEAKISGFRRFGNDDGPHKLLVDSKLACIIGSNEAGKSSLLRVIGEGIVEAPISQRDRTRLAQVADEHQILELRYRLDDADRDAIAHLFEPGMALPHCFTVTKTAGGSIDFRMDRRTRRSRAVRQAAREALENATHTRLLAIAADDEHDDRDEAAGFVERTAALREAISDEPATLDAEALEAAEALAAELRDADESEAAAHLDSLVSAERERHPSVVADDILWDRTPDFVSFGAGQRDLDSEYDLTVVTEEPPVALANLARLAELRLPHLLSLIEDNETGTVRFLLDQANRRLEEVFANWTQKPPVRVEFDTSGTNLLVHVRSGADVPMRFEERSDGLRQFVALVAATAQSRQTGPPILLIDEVETHLHYDAQVDLIRVLTEQDAVRQVIYTTHSAACLPDDLGSVRVIESDATRTRSRIRQHFWSDAPGLGPLLMAMGAASLAFVPRRAAVIAEGPSELLLLPTLVRQASGQEDLGYQVAPGLAGARPNSIIGLDLEAPRTAWLVDGDRGGAAHRDKLLSEGIPDDAILILGGANSGVTLEDLVDAGALADAVSAYARDKGQHDEFPSRSLGKNRMAAIERWCEKRGIQPPSKVVLANRLVSMRAERTLVAEDHRETLIGLHAAARALLHVERLPSPEPQH